DRERQPIEPVTDLWQSIVHGKAWKNRSCAVREETDGLIFCKRRDREFTLALHMEWLPAGREHAQSRTGTKQCRNIRGRRDHLLKVVQDQQDLSVIDVVRDISPSTQSARHLRENTR